MSIRLTLVTVLALLPATVAYSQSVIEKLAKDASRAAPVLIPPVTVDRDGNVRVKSPSEVLNDSLNSVPGYGLLSDADKKNIQAAIVTTGAVAAVVSDPVGGTIFIKILSGPDAKEDTVAIPVGDPTPTGKSWEITATCIAQQEGKLITAYFNTDPVPEVSNIADGDTVNLTAPTCPIFKDKSVTSVTIRKTGGNPLANRKPPQYTYVLIGNAT